MPLLPPLLPLLFPLLPLLPPCNPLDFLQSWPIATTEDLSWHTHCTLSPMTFGTKNTHLYPIPYRLSVLQADMVSCTTYIFHLSSYSVFDRSNEIYERYKSVDLYLQEGPDSMEAMEKALKFILIWGGLFAMILIPIWPLLALAAGTFSQG